MRPGFPHLTLTLPGYSIIREDRQQGRDNSVLLALQEDLVQTELRVPEWPGGCQDWAAERLAHSSSNLQSRWSNHLPGAGPPPLLPPTSCADHGGLKCTPPLLGPQPTTTPLTHTRKYPVPSPPEITPMASQPTRSGNQVTCPHWRSLCPRPIPWQPSP